MADFFKPMFTKPNYKWVLKRIDDNGNEFEMKKFESYSFAKKEMKKYEAKAHKQTYFIEKLMVSLV